MPDLFAPPKELILPAPRVGAPLTGQGQVLAGHSYLWFRPDEVLCDGPLTPQLQAYLTAPRADICQLSMDRPRIMGILNVTPDSFSDGGRHQTMLAALAHGHRIAEACDFIDIGGESTRPGAAEVPVEEEIRRTAPVIRALRAEGITLPISIDTRKAAVAEAALDAGADLVNDVTALRFDPRMAALVAERDVAVCLMHSTTDPATMQDRPQYRDVLREVRDHLAERIEAALAAGINPARIVLDPGIGFGKTTAHNLTLLRHMACLHGFGLPVLLGVSRKRFIGELSGTEIAAERMPGSVALALLGAAAGMQILRVHDTKETRQALDIWQATVGTLKENEHVA